MEQSGIDQQFFLTETVNAEDRGNLVYSRPEKLVAMLSWSGCTLDGRFGF